MPNATVSMEVREAGPGVSLIAVHGEVTAAAEDPLMNAYHEANRNNPKVIILNFSELEYLNSTGIGLLVTLLIRANRQGQRIIAAGLNEHYRHIFELTRLDEAIQICHNEAQALAAAGV